MAELANDLTRLVLRMTPCWDLIDPLRRFSERFCETARLSPDRASQLALAVHELMQNAVKHAGGDDVELSLSVDRDAGLALVSRNRCTAEQFADVSRRIDRLVHQENALAAYLAAVIESGDRPGGIGLARIRCEAQLDLGARYDGSHLEILATGPAEAPEAVQTWEERGWLPSP